MLKSLLHANPDKSVVFFPPRVPKNSRATEFVNPAPRFQIPKHRWNSAGFGVVQVQELRPVERSTSAQGLGGRAAGRQSPEVRSSSTAGGEGGGLTAAKSH